MRRLRVCATFPPQKARRLAQQFERHHTAKHGSGLNISESEIAAVIKTGLRPRIESLEELQNQLRAVVKRRTHNSAEADWQFANKDARIKLRSPYPSTQY